MDEIKPGDVFELSFTVKEVARGGAYARNSRGNLDWFDNVLLAAGRRVARPLGIGDRVKFKGTVASGLTWIIDAISRDGKQALLTGNSPEIWTQAPIVDLERAPAPDTKEGT